MTVAIDPRDANSSPDKSPRRGYPHDHVCEATDCTNLSPTSKHCSNACRSRMWKIDHDYRDHRKSVPNASQRRQTRREARYLILKQDGPNLTITGAIVAASKRAAEKRVGDQPHVCVIAASHLPAIDGLPLDKSEVTR